MANVSVTIPLSLETETRDLCAQRGISLDCLVTYALSEYVQSYGRHMFQSSTTAALVEGVYSGSISSSIFLKHGSFGLGTFEIYQARGDVGDYRDNSRLIEMVHEGNIV